MNLTADGKSTSVQIPAGSTVDQVLTTAGLKLGSLDRTDPPVYTILTSSSNVRLVRVTEKFEIEQVVIPFERQTLRNESLPKDKEVLLQSGKNGLREITYRRVFEDGMEVSGKPIPIKNIVIEQPLPEIVMTGVQKPFSPIAIPGRLVYIRDGSAWTIEETTSNRRAIVTTGDLDGYVFSLSSDGSWLLFTRRSGKEGEINTLWAAPVDGKPEDMISLDVANVIYFADWLPGSTTEIIYSTVEPQVSAPGWHTNNDLNYLVIFKSTRSNSQEVVLKSNLAGAYPWWGVSFSWAPGGGLKLAYANDHTVGVLDLLMGENSPEEASSSPRLEFNPLQTHSSWAWVPGVSWGPDGKVLYTVDHVAPPGMTLPEESQVFDLTALPPDGGAPIHLVSQVGMFAYPIASPLQPKSSGEQAHQVAYLQATFPDQSETSRYRLMVMDRDGSNRRALFPEEGVPGLTPQREWGAWSPGPMPETNHYTIALIHQGNLWLVDVTNGDAWQVTADGLTSRIAWIPAANP